MKNQSAILDEFSPTELQQKNNKLNDTSKRLRKFFKGKRLVRIFMYIFLLDLTFVFLYPFIYMLVTSFKSPADLLDVTVNWLINTFHINNYELSWEVLDYPRYLSKTFLVTALCTLGHLLSCAFIGYGFARFKFKGKNFLFVMLLLSIIIPPQTIITPIFMVFDRLNLIGKSLPLIGSSLPLVLPTWLGFGLKGGLFIFIFRQFYLSLPRSLEEAAGIDGCGPFSTFFRIAFPSSRSSIMVCLVLSIVWHWNDYFEPTIYLSNRSDYLLPMILPTIYDAMKSAGSVGATGEVVQTLFTEGVAMAATVLVIVPVFVMYMFLQKKFIQGVERSGITGE